MPIRPENRHRYPLNWPEIRADILARAGNRCEGCQAPNGELIARGSDDTYMLHDGEVRDADTGEALGYAKGSEYPVERLVRVVLTIAHLDHTPENCDPANLRAWCQRCHNRYDAPQRAQGIRERRLQASGQMALGIR